MSATAIEAASMLPYLAALGLLAASGMPARETGLILAGYCLVMIIPALVLLSLRIEFHDRISRVLERLDAWLSRNSGELTAWVLFLVGLFLAGDAVQALGWIDRFTPPAIRSAGSQ